MGKLFEDSSIAGMKLKNRIIRSATHEGLGDKDGRPLPEPGIVNKFKSGAQDESKCINCGYCLWELPAAS